MDTTQKPNKYKPINQELAAWLDYFAQLDPGKYTLFHLTTTYRPYDSKTYTPRDVNKFFINFYLKNLLPDLFNARTWTNSRKLRQPIALAFIDEHAPDVKQTATDSRGTPIWQHADRLHHHTIIASKPYTREALIALSGENTMLRYSPIMATSYMTRCDANCVTYAAKMHRKYEEYLLFGYKD
jgi:hypothetical protein